MSARVLVIDDSPMIVELLRKALAGAGVEADSASDLATLDLRLKGGQHELVLVDVNMPEMYGDDVVEFLRAQHKLQAQLLLYSDLPEAELEAKTKSSGADGFIAKSAGVESAVEEVKRRLVGAAPRAGKRILVVDDSHATGKLLAGGAEGEGLRGGDRPERRRGDQDHPEEEDPPRPGAARRAHAQRQRRAVLPLHQVATPSSRGSR